MVQLHWVPCVASTVTSKRTAPQWQPPVCRRGAGVGAVVVMLLLDVAVCLDVESTFAERNDSFVSGLCVRWRARRVCEPHSLFRQRGRGLLNAFHAL
jgi:hypothetical protein